MHYVISYDIADNKRRIKIADFLETYGLRTQYSVFECEADSALIQHIVSSLQEMIDMKEDSVLCYALCKHCSRQVHTQGIAFQVTNMDWQVL